jgi:hypothetical protein
MFFLILNFCFQLWGGPPMDINCFPLTSACCKFRLHIFESSLSKFFYFKGLQALVDANASIRRGRILDKPLICVRVSVNLGQS